MSHLFIKRVYEEAEESDGYRILVDRIWPRGISKEKAKLDEWDKEIAPSTELRKWYNHEIEKFEEFSARYKLELEDKQEDIRRIRELAKTQRVCLVFSAKAEKYSQAEVLLEYLTNDK